MRHHVCTSMSHPRGRVVVYGSGLDSVQDFTYKIRRPTRNYLVPPAQGDSMYDRTVQAPSPAGRDDR